MKNYFQILPCFFFLLSSYTLTAQCDNPRLDIYATYSVSETNSFVLQIAGGFDAKVYSSLRFKFNVTLNHDFRNWDNAPGGNRQDIARSLKKAVETSLMGQNFQNLPTDVPTGVINAQTFIPSISALDIQTGIDNVNIDISTAIGGNPLSPNTSVTPFAAVYFTAQNQTPKNENHVQISTLLGDFIIAQMQAAQVTLQSPLLEPYNYGLIRSVIPSVTVASGGILAVNNSGRTAYVNRTTSEASAAKPVFEALITSGCDANVVVQSGGKIQLGAGWSNSGILRIITGSTLTLQSGSTVEVNNVSQIVVESGGKLIINAGANINLASATAQIVVKNGGELIINGTNNSPNSTFNYTGTGYFSFEAGNKLTLNSDWVLRGIDRNTRLINVENNASITVNEGHRWTIQNALVRKVGTTSNDVLVFNNGATFFAENVTTGGGIDIQRMYWLQMRNTTMRGGPAGSGYTNNTIGVKLTFSIHNWIRGNNIISDYGTGIEATHQGILHSMNGNIILSDKTTIQSCKTAIKQDGGADYGLLYMDCTAILKNELGIMGTDILLSAYSRGSTANIYTRPESKFGGLLFFKNTFDVRQETDIWLLGSYWNNLGNTPSETVVNDFWQFWQNGSPWQGRIHLGTPATAGNVDNNCGGVNLRDAPTDSLAIANSIVQVNNEYRNVRIQQDAALSQLKQNNLAEAIALFAPVAAIINGVRDTANAAVRHFVDVARTMALGSNGVTIRSKSNGWLPETLVEVPKKIDNTQFMVYPNPANTFVQMELKKGNYNLRVSSAIGQTIFAQNTEGVLSVNVSTWTNGIYLFELTDKTTNKRQHSKIVIQH
jgi:hypothetical protein